MASDLDERLTVEMVDFSDLERLWKRRRIEEALAVLSPSVLAAAKVAFRWLANKQAYQDGGSGALANLFSQLGDFGASSVLSSMGNTDIVCASEFSPVLPELHVLSSPELGHAVFHPPTFTLFRVNERAALVLEDCAQREASIEAVARRRGVSVKEIESFVARIDQVVRTRSPVESAGEMRGALQKLVLTVSNDCNMRCRYCYASGGSYGKSRVLMTPSIAHQATARVFEHFRSVQAVMFFGGEPTLNPGAIEACCEQVLELYSQGTIFQLPRFGMVTNGLVLDQKVLDIIQRYKLLVTVSLDGPAEINDLLRVSCDGQDSFQRIARNIHRIQEATGGREPSRIEATYTSAHHAAGFSVVDLVDYFDREFGIRDCHVVPVTVEPGHKLGCRRQLEDADMFREAAVQLIDSWSTENPRQLFSISRCLLAIAIRLSSPYLCGAGLSELTVSALGDIYPCYMLFEDTFKMGSVIDPQVFQSERFRTVQQCFHDNAKPHLDKCTRCWARGFCRVCLKVPYVENRTIGHIPDHVCAINQAVAEAGLLALSRAWAKPDQWELLCGNVAGMVNKSWREGASTNQSTHRSRI